ncbi:MAG: macro domain-containing protein [Nitrososphaeraceae archaeon]|nr:macro domain-containing protein [Nitrososphaeraceae archaeon]
MITTTQLIDEIRMSNDKIIIRLIKGDITDQNVDVIVNPANSYLKHGGGVAGAIVRKGGKIIQTESDKIDFVPVGSSVITTSGELPCQAIIHTVGPKMGEGNEDFKLSKSLHSSLSLASDHNYKSISIPAISSGIFGFPKDRCANILLDESIKFLQNNNTTLETIEFCIIDDETLFHFKNKFKNLKKKNFSSPNNF